jgi:hypothetical protein|tara:strand:- start:37547 stop:38050 length:504 start_codon:yes stop_codon:yes gene_type:complete
MTKKDRTMSFKPVHIRQMELVTAISNELSRQVPDLPFDVGVYNTIITAANLVIDECKRERVLANKPMTPTEWLASDDVGMSSRYLLSLLTDEALFKAEYAVPHDADDLGRCIRMVEVCHLQESLQKLEKQECKWKEIGERWWDLVELYTDKDYKQIYDFLSDNTSSM